MLVDITPGVNQQKAKAVIDFIDGPQSFASFDDLLARTIQHNPTRSESSLRRGILHNAHPTAAGDWFFDGHFPGEPVVPAIVLVELLAQTGGLAIGSGAAGSEPLALRVAALGAFKFPGAATAGDVLEATARVVGRMGGLYKVEGEVTAGGRVVGAGAVTLAEVRR